MATFIADFLPRLSFPVNHTDSRGWLWEYGSDAVGRQLLRMTDTAKWQYVNLGVLLAVADYAEVLDKLGSGSLKECLPEPDAYEDVAGGPGPQPLWDVEGLDAWLSSRIAQSASDFGNVADTIE